jgi:hypothetical protein
MWLLPSLSRCIILNADNSRLHVRPCGDTALVGDWQPWAIVTRDNLPKV